VHRPDAIPIAQAPPLSQTNRDNPCDAVTLPARSSAAYAANTAINIDKATSR